MPILMKPSMTSTSHWARRLVVHAAAGQSPSASPSPVVAMPDAMFSGRWSAYSAGVLVGTVGGAGFAPTQGASEVTVVIVCHR